MAGRRQRITGQTYAERLLAPPVSFSNGPSWVHESPYLYKDFEEKRPVGASRLKELAMKRVLSDQRSLTPELFANVPWDIAHEMWQCLGRSGKQTMYMWKLFATAYQVEFRKVSQYRSMKIGFPMMPVQDYLGLVNDDSLNWGVTLFLSTIYARTPDLVGISRIKNLVALDIFTPLHPSFDTPDEALTAVALNDRIIRTWCELVRNSGAFRSLRALRLIHQDDVSETLFEYLAVFPSLRMLIVHDCKSLGTGSSKAFAERYGWEVRSGPPHQLDDYQGMEDTDSIYRLYQETNALRDCGVTVGACDLAVDTPILDFEIGIKRKSNKSQPIVFLRRQADQPRIAETVMRKRKLTGSDGGSASYNSTKSRKPVMKERGKQDITGMLAEFL
ncbi:conserved hypothetical protein [Paecilomyces variotii No. 5]|uniref:Cbs domain-containing protein n=1 Tax=Byssochlamys spectabilis (strain No. 5 / NBRC 109023) TaxID=1356009 RepID=V5FAD2_BYSSN|nr:conserved hypothetical protein [Paecilomyces variotii No. 5]